jgi:outer membrane protein OmpA-like peptidoglycan-associated protein
MKLRTALMAASILALPAAAMAQPISGLYVGAGAGVNFLQPVHVSGVTTTAGTVAASGGLSSQAGFAGVGSVGYGLGNGLRFELEGDYRYNKLYKFPPAGVHGAEEQYGGMGNVLFDFNLAPYGIPWMMPYVGVGAGYDQIKMDTLRLYGTTKTSVSYLTKDGSEGGFAYQGIAGVAFPIPAVPGLALTAEYRFLGEAGNLNYKGTLYAPAGAFGTGSPASITNSTLHTTTNYNQSAMFGIRYNFGVAPPPAAAAVVAPVPPPASRTYLVFFDWDRADLTARAKQIVKEAADASTKTQYTKIQVNGYTDLSGTAAYNQRLSVRRAQAVAAELVRDGVPRAAISIQGFGESNPLVPTAKGVREPQNRRVEIIIQ